MGGIVTKDQAISKAIADAACASLDKEVDRKREEGALKAGTWSSVRLEWTPQTHQVAEAFQTVFEKESANVAPIRDLGGNPRGQLKWACPIIYCDVLPEPIRYPSSALGFGTIGIIALGALDMPEVGDSGPKSIESGSVAYFRDSSPIIYRASKGRGIMFYISN